MGIRSYLDGARLFNAAAASGLSVAELAAPFDLVSAALSKGLGCPIGSMIAGTNADMQRAVHIRRMFGGALRQAGIIAAAGIYALDHNIGRLGEDHTNARLIAEKICAAPGVKLDLKTVQSNIIIVNLAESAPDADEIALRARKSGVLLSVFGRKKLRAVTHLNVSRNDCTRAAETLVRVFNS